MIHRSTLRFVSTALLGAAVGGGLTYKVLVSNTVECLVEAPHVAALPPPPIHSQPYLDMTNGKRY